jgi:hypothetical protein
MSHTFESLTAMNPADLEAVLAAGVAPSLSSIVGHEFRGWNVFGDVIARVVGTVMGIQRFAKGWFIRDGGDVDAAPFIEGYNVKVRRGEKTDAWTALPDDDHPTRHGFFRVFRAGEGEGRAGRHPQALLLDYALGIPRAGLLGGGGLKDFVVQVDVDNPDLLLGKAYMTIGPVTNAAGFFVLQRLRQVDFKP